MNICFVSREFIGSKRGGGIATYVYDMSRSLIAEGHTIYVICASDNISKKSKIIYEGINLIKLSGADFYICNNKNISRILTKIRSILFYNSYRKKIVVALNELNNKIGLDIVEFPEFGDEAKFWMRNKNNVVPSVVRFHGPSGHNRTTNTINTYSRKVRDELETAFISDGISYCSNAIKTLIINTDYSNKLYINFQKIQNIIFNPIFLEDRLISNKLKKKYIFTAGSFVKNKGFGELVEAIKLINEQGNSIELIIAGKLGVLGEFYRNKELSDSCYSPWLNIVGPLKREDLFNYYKNADLCCFPSHWESFGLICIEAMSVEGLVLGSSSGGMSEIIEEGKDGFLVEPLNIELLKNKIEHILHLDESKLNEIRKKAKEKIKLQFSSTVICKPVITFYTNVIKNAKHK